MNVVRKQLDNQAIGVLPLLLFLFFFIKLCKICILRFNVMKYMFLVLLALNLIYWFKVSTDIFLVFALFLCVSKEENEEYEKCYLMNNQPS